MGYAIDADRIVKDRQIHAAANFCVDCFDDMTEVLSVLLRKRAEYARKLIETGYEYVGADNDHIEAFEMVNNEIKKLLGI